MAERVCSRDYLFCKICKRNHLDGRKHIFSKKHKEKLDYVLKRFGAKVRDARVMLNKPLVVDGELEPGAKVWCYCCEEDVDKHVTDGMTSIEYGGLLEHMASKNHHKKTKTFWWENGAEKSQLQKFILFEAEIDRFKTSLSRELEKLDLKREERTKQLADKIRQTELIQQQIATSNSSSELTPQPLFGPTPSSSSSSVHVSSQLPAYSSTRGNVHTGAVPPWLMDGDNDSKLTGSSSGVRIGPSEDEFIKWKEKQGKSGKNPKRVGADFHRNLKRMGLWDNDDEDWLPNFGRVWNAGPRSHSRKEFKSECLSTPAVPLDTSAVQSSSISTSSSSNDLHFNSISLPSVQPYVRKRPLKRPHPDSSMPSPS